MKNSISLLASMLLLFSSFYFKKYTEDIEVIAAISADKMNVFYIGVPNTISIAISDVSIEETIVSISNGRIRENDKKGHYTVSVFEEGETTIYLEGKDKYGNKVRSESTFRVKRIPDPTPVLGSKGGGLIGLDGMKAQRRIIVPLSFWGVSGGWKVLSFRLECVREGKTFAVLKNKGATFSEEIRKLIEETKVGDYYFFTEIVVTGPDYFVRKIEPMSFKVKQ